MKYSQIFVNFKENKNIKYISCCQLPEEPCIYCWTNNLNNKKYIGQALNLKVRTYNHLKRLLKGENSLPYFYNALSSDGLENFTLEVLENVSAEELDEKEKYYINLYNTTSRKKGYNLTAGGCPFSENINKGRIRISNGKIIKNVFFEEAKDLLSTKQWGYGASQPYYLSEEEINLFSEEFLSEIKKRKRKRDKENKSEEYKEYSKKYHQDNKERIQIQHKLYNETHKEEISLKNKKDRKENPKKYKERYEKYYKKNREKILEEKRQFVKDFPEENRKNHKKYYEAHREEILKKDKERRQLKKNAEN